MNSMKLAAVIVIVITLFACKKPDCEYTVDGTYSCHQIEYVNAYGMQDTIDHGMTSIEIKNISKRRVHAQIANNAGSYDYNVNSCNADYDGEPGDGSGDGFGTSIVFYQDSMVLQTHTYSEWANNWTHRYYCGKN